MGANVRTHVSSHYNFRLLSPRRKVALGFAALYFVVFVTWVLPNALRTPPQSWSPIAVLLCVGLGAFSTAIVVLEMVRSTVQRTAGWTDEKHFWLVMLAFGAFFVVQLTGVLLGQSSFK